MDVGRARDGGTARARVREAESGPSPALSGRNAAVKRALGLKSQGISALISGPFVDRVAQRGLVFAPQQEKAPAQKTGIFPMQAVPKEAN